MNIEHVLEFSRPDIDGDMIRAVKVIGLKSKNGWSYSPTVLKEAMPLYEASPVFIEHPDAREKKAGHRQLGDHFGSLQNVRGNGQGLFADLQIKRSHPLASAVLEAAPTARFGLSHNAVVEMDEKKIHVLKILEVNSVDLVNKPATTTNLFEEDEMEEFKKEVLACLAKIEAHITEQIAKKVAVTESASVTPPVKRLVALEATGDGGDKGETHNHFLARIRGY